MSDDLEARIEALTGRTAAARLRAVMPVIDRKVREGVRHEDIVEALQAAGLSVSLNTFRVEPVPLPQAQSGCRARLRRARTQKLTIRRRGAG